MACLIIIKSKSDQLAIFFTTCKHFMELTIYKKLDENAENS